MDSSSIAIAVDFGGTKVETAAVTTSGSVVPGSRFRAPTGSANSTDAAADIARSVSDVVERTAQFVVANGYEAVGIGIGCAGPVNSVAGTVSPLNVPSWRDYPLRDLVTVATRHHLGHLPTQLRIDGEAIALAEHWIGAGQGAAALLGMVVSTGVGGGLVIGGRTLPGPTGNAGHIGHIGVGGSDEPCACGMIGCVEAVASGPRSVAWARRQGWGGHTGEDLAASYRSGDEIAVAAVRRSADAVGRGIASATALLDLDRVAIGGGFSRVAPDYIEWVRKPIALSVFPFVRKVEVVASALSADGPLIGAAALVLRSEHLG